LSVKSKGAAPIASKKFKQALFLLLLVAICGYAAYTIFNKKRIIKYKNFGITVPANFNIHGIDVSKHQGQIEWDEVSKMEDRGVKLAFAFIKSTEGTSLADEKFEQNFAAAKKHHIIRGAYHFFIPSRNGTAQAQQFIRHTPLQKGDLPPVLDIERFYGTTKEQLITELQTWCTLVEAKYGVKPIIYTNAKFYETYLAGSFDNYPLWVAHYLVNNKPNITRNWLFWQHSERGRVNGILENVDFNVFNGGNWALQSLLIN
jgi:lysozyme